MKKFLLIVAVVSLCFVGISKADEGYNSYTVALSTYPVTEATTLSPDLAYYGARIYKIILTNDSVSQEQTISMYDQADDTNTVTLKGRLYMLASATQDQTIILDYSLGGTKDSWKVDNFAIRKSTTGSNVQATIYYR